MWLETNHEAAIIRLLENAKRVGKIHVVFEMQPANMGLQPHQILVFNTLDEAIVEFEKKEGLGYLPVGEKIFPFFIVKPTS